MELNNLLEKIKNQEQQHPKRFLALELTEEILQTAVWEVKNAKTHLVSTGSIESRSQKDKLESLLEKIDISLSHATEGLEKEPNEVIFGLPNQWVQKDSIKSDKKTLIKKICQELALKPLGFVVLTESLIRYLKIKEGTPLNAILAHITDTEITVSHVRQGRILSAHIVGRGTDICQDLEEGISCFKTTQAFPSRIIVFNGNQDMEEIIQNLTSYDWQNKFNFLHLPQVESLPRDTGISAVAVAGGSEVAKAIGFEIDFDQEEVTQEKASTPPQASKQLDRKLDRKPEFESVSPPPSSSEEIGFVKDKDVKELASQEPSSPTPRPAKQPPQEQPTQPSTTQASAFFFSLSNFFSQIPKFFSRLPKPKFPQNFFSRLSTTKLTLLPVVLLVLFGLGFAFFWFVPKSTISLYVKPKTLEEPLNLTVSQTASSINQEQNIIPGEEVTKTLSDSSTKSTTGTKLVGDPAKGKVTIYNRTFLNKTFEAGTEISYEDLAFTLDESVTIASGSATSFGTETVPVTAEQIGEESNLSSNTEFFVDDYDKSSFAAKNQEAFSGGTSEEIQVVSEEDQTTLLEELTQKLLDQAEEKLKEETGGEKAIFFQSERSKVVNQEFTQDIGEEASNLTLNLELEAAGITYQKQDIEKLVNEKIQEAIPEGWERVDEPIEVDTSSSTQEDNSVLLDTIVKVKLIPKVDKAKLKTQIKSKSPQTQILKPIFEKISGYERAEVKITPEWLPPRLRKIPRNPKNITLNIESI